MTDVSIQELRQLLKDNSDPDGQWRGADVCDALANLIHEKSHPEQVKPERQLSLERAIALTCGDRNRDYGAVRPNMEAVAAMWSAYKGVKFEAHDVPAMMMLLKIARISVSPWKMDNWDDAAAYGGMGAEVRPESPVQEMKELTFDEKELLQQRAQELEDALVVTMQPKEGPAPGLMCSK